MEQRRLKINHYCLYTFFVPFARFVFQSVDVMFQEASGHVMSRQEVVNVTVWQLDPCVIDVW